MAKRNRGPRVAFRKDRAWWGVFEYRNGSRHWFISGLASEREAEEQFALWKRQKPGAVDPGKRTVGEIMAYYLEHHVPHTATPDKALSFHETLTPFWASLTVGDVNKAKCQEYCSKRNKHRDKTHGKPFSNDTLRRELEHLAAALNYAVDNTVIPVAPRLWKPGKARSRQRWLTRGEAALLLKAARTQSGYLYLFILLGLYTGARAGAILSLKWSQVDLERGLIDYRPAQRSQNKGYAVVPIPRKLLRELKKQERNPFGYVVNDRGHPVKSVKRSFKSACRRAGLADVSPNTLRHTHGSWLRQKGLASSLIAENLGHSSTKMVESVYGHMGEAYREAVRNAF